MQADTKQTTLRLPDGLYEALRGISETRGRSINQVVIQALWAYTKVFLQN